MIEKIVNRPAPFIDRNFATPARTETEAGEGFGETLRGLLQDVNKAQLEANEALDGFLAGDIQNLHQVMIKAEEAQLSLQLTVQVVNKVIQAYQEISRMQI